MIMSAMQMRSIKLSQSGYSLWKLSHIVLQKHVFTYHFHMTDYLKMYHHF